ncbi:Arp complex subunit [Tilletia horrida]|nr:Arp complex subunit [Tilletia horrida]
MTTLDDIRTLWVLGSNPHTRQRSRSPSPTAVLPTLPGIDTTLPASQQLSIADAALRKSARSTHLPSRGAYHEREKMARAVYGYPPFGSSADADQLSEEEIMLEQRRDEQINFGYRHYVQIGRKRTAFEEELSNEEEDFPPDQSRMSANASGSALLSNSRSRARRRGRATANTTTTSAGGADATGVGAGARDGDFGEGGGSDDGGRTGGGRAQLERGATGPTTPNLADASPSFAEPGGQSRPATVAAAQRTAAAAAAARAAASASQNSMEEISQQEPDLDADIEDMD